MPVPVPVTVHISLSFRSFRCCRLPAFKRPFSPTQLRHRQMSSDPVKEHKSDVDESEEVETSSQSKEMASPVIKKNAVEAQNSPSAQAAASFKLVLLVCMVLQNSSTVLVGRHTRSSVPKEELYVVNHLILVCEGMKVRKTYRTTE